MEKSNVKIDSEVINRLKEWAIEHGQKRAEVIDKAMKIGLSEILANGIPYKPNLKESDDKFLIGKNRAVLPKTPKPKENKEPKRMGRPPLPWTKKESDSLVQTMCRMKQNKAYPQWKEMYLQSKPQHAELVAELEAEIKRSMPSLG